MIVKGRLVVPGMPGQRRRITAKNGAGSASAATLYAALDSPAKLASNILEFGPGEYFKTVFVDPALMFVDDPDTGRVIGDLRGERVLNRAWFDISDPEFGGKNNTNCGAAANKALAAAERAMDTVGGIDDYGGGGVMFPAWDRTIVDETLKWGVRTAVTGASSAFASRLKRHASLYGPIFEQYVSILAPKSQNPPQPRMSRLFMAGDMVGVTSFFGTSTAGTNTLTGVGAGVINAARIGDSVCAWGFPFPSYVTDKDAGAGTLTLNNVSARNSIGVLTKTSCWLWEGYVKVCQPVTAGVDVIVCDPTGLRVGMRAEGTPFGAIDDPGDGDGDDEPPVDSDDLVAQKSMIVEILSNGVRLDRAAATGSGGATFAMRFRRYDDFVYAPRLQSYGVIPTNYKAIGPILEDVVCQYNNGPAVRVEPKRNSARVLGGKYTNNGAGVLISSSSDSEISGVAIGVNRLEGFRMSTQATANASYLENYQCYRGDITSDGVIYKCPTSHLHGGEGYNGRYRIIGGGLTAPGVHRVTGTAFRHHESSCLEDNTMPGYVEVFGQAHVDIGAGVSFEPDQPKNSKATHLVYFGPNNASASANLTTDTWLDPTDPRCPFRTSITDKPLQLVGRVFNRSTKQMTQIGRLNADAGITYGGKLVKPTVQQAGRKVLFIYGSEGAQQNPIYPANAATYTRDGNGGASIRTTEEIYFLPDQPMKLNCLTRPDIEIDSVCIAPSIQEGPAWRHYFKDDRPFQGPLGGGVGCAILDRRAWLGARGIIMMVNALMGNPMVPTVWGTGGAGFTDWQNAYRREQIIAKGPWHSIVWVVFGNAVLGGGSTSSQIMDLAAEAFRFGEPISRYQYAVTPRAIRGNADSPFTPNTTGWVRGSRTLDQMRSQLPDAFQGVKIINAGEGMEETFGNADTYEILNGTYAVLDGDIDGIHGGPNITVRSCMPFAAGLELDLQPVSGRSRGYPDNQQMASGLDGGGKVYNAWKGWFGNVVDANAGGTDVSGRMPLGGGILPSNGGRVIIKSRMELDPVAGSWWMVNLDQVTASNGGCVVDIGFQADWLLATLNANPGKRMELTVPMTWGGFAPDSVIQIIVGMYAVTGGREYLIAAPMEDAGEERNFKTDPASIRGWSGCLNLPLRAPDVNIPTGVTFTEAGLRVRLRLAPLASGIVPGPFDIGIGAEVEWLILPTATGFPELPA